MPVPIPDDLKEFGDTTARLLKNCENLERTASQLLFTLGDYVNAGFAKFGDDALQYLPDTDYAPKTLINVRWVCKKVPRANRRPDVLHFDHHSAVSALEPEKQRELLNTAAEEKLTARELRARVRAIKQGKKPEKPEPEKIWSKAEGVNGIQVWLNEDQLVAEFFDTENPDKTAMWYADEFIALMEGQ